MIFNSSFVLILFLIMHTASHARMMVNLFCISCPSLISAIAAKANGTLMTHELKDQLEDAAVSTGKALSHVRRNRNTEDEQSQQTTTMSVDDMIADKTKEKDENKMSPEIAVMQPILRFLQLLCENHNQELQVWRPFHWWFFTRGQYWPSGIVVACVCLCVCVSVRVSITSLSAR